MRINTFENINNLYNCGNFSVVGMGNGSLNIHGVYIPGSLSFNNLAAIVSGSGAVSENLSLSFGLYSLNGSTLSLANSASLGTGLTLNQTMFSWVTFATSGIQDITPGNWYFGVIISTSLGSKFSLVRWNEFFAFSNVDYGGPFVRGRFSASTGALPSSIATSDLTKEATVGPSRHPYILISA